MRLLSTFGFNSWLTHCLAFFIGCLAFFPYQEDCVVSLEGIVLAVSEKKDSILERFEPGVEIYALRKFGKDYCLISNIPMILRENENRKWLLFESKISSLLVVKAFLEDDLDDFTYSPNSYSPCSLKKRIRYD